MCSMCTATATTVLLALYVISALLIPVVLLRAPVLHAVPDQPQDVRLRLWEQ